MTAVDLRARLGGVVPPDRVRADVVLAPFTTFRVGGPADWLVEVLSEGELTGTMAAARALGLPMTVLGGGSNVLVADAGIRGVVIRPRLKGVSQPAPERVRAEAGLTMNGLVRWTIGRGLAGLEAWAGTPGTVGGAIYGNAHFGGRNIGDLVSWVRLIDADGAVIECSAADMGFAYDTSRLQQSSEVLVSADFRVSPGDVEALRAAARVSLAYRKETQPLALSTAGCVFQNPDPARDRVPDDVPASAGALVDRAGLKDFRIGGAHISNTHANFVVNDGSATARDVRAVIETARRRVLEQFGDALRDEVVFLGQFELGQG
jgi:UDP-N-acetylmuramate dehydrogenase